jgi:hypothetical protein
MDKPSIFEALNAVAVEVGAVRKGDRNQQQGFNFRGVDAVVNAVAPALRKAGVVVVPEVLDVEYCTVEVGQRRTPMGHCRVRVRYTWYGPGGDSVASTVVAESMDAGDKASPKAMSVAYRTAILQTLALPTDDPEPDAQTYQRSDRDRRENEDLRNSDEAYSPINPAKLRRRMFALYREANVGNTREERLAFASAVVGRTIQSSDELTPDEVGMVIAALQARLAEPKEAAS